MPRERWLPGLPGRLESTTLSLLPTELPVQCHLNRPFGGQGAATCLVQGRRCQKMKNQGRWAGETSKHCAASPAWLWPPCLGSLRRLCSWQTWGLDGAECAGTMGTQWLAGQPSVQAGPAESRATSVIPQGVQAAGPMSLLLLCNVTPVPCTPDLPLSRSICGGCVAAMTDVTNKSLWPSAGAVWRRGW